MRLLRTILLSLVLAMIISFASNGSAAWENMKFRLGINDIAAEEYLVASAIKQYNIDSATFYNTAGSTVAGLDVIPAAKLLKRRLFKDINMLKRDGLLMVFDRDRDAISRIYFPRRNLAIAETEEVWFVALQDAKTREPFTGTKAVEIKVRYTFIKEPYYDKGIRWVAHYVDVYPINEEIPVVNMASVL